MLYHFIHFNKDVYINLNNNTPPSVVTSTAFGMLMNNREIYVSVWSEILLVLENGGNGYANAAQLDTPSNLLSIGKLLSKLNQALPWIGETYTVSIGDLNSSSHPSNQSFVPSTVHSERISRSHSSTI